MKVTSKRISAALLACVALTTFSGVQAAFDEHLDNYQLDAKVVKGDRSKDQFGNTVTEQSYYRTGGDVKVITRDEIEKRHYSDLTEAIKRIPGITFQNPGYRGGEYGFQFFNNGISINGDTRVIVLVDGRRVDNSTSTRIAGSSESGSKSTGVNLDQVININAVDKIEVIKGPGASVYGSDATGGAINIITRKGEATKQGSIDVSTGTWGKHNYDLSYSGSAGNDNSLHYYVGLHRVMSGDTKYRDGHTGDIGILGGSRFDERGANVRLDKDFSDTERLTVSINHQQGKDGYPISTPNQKYWNKKDWNQIIFKAAVGERDEDGKLVLNEDYSGDYDNENKYKIVQNEKGNPAYHNLFALDGFGYNSYSKYKNNDVDVKYTFDRQSDMESFVRLYRQSHQYLSSDKYAWVLHDDGMSNKAFNLTGDQFTKDFPDGAKDGALLDAWIEKNLAPFPGGSKAALEEWVAKTGGKAQDPRHYYDERKRGIQLQVARSIGKHDIIANVSYDKDQNDHVYQTSKGKVKTSVKRNSLYGYVQDKIHVNDNFDVTPAVRFAKYSDYITEAGKSLGGDPHVVTPSLNLQYQLHDGSTVYAGWTKVLRPLRSGDYVSAYDGTKTNLQDEKGNVYTLGYQKIFNKKTTVGVNYSLTDMTNAIASFEVRTPNGFESVPVNATQKKTSFNLTVDHKLNKNWTVGVAYSHLKDKWSAKPGYVVNPAWNYNDSGDINTGINKLRPANHYTLNINYDAGKVSSGLLVNYYTGSNIEAFTSKRFVILDWNLNYDVNKDLTTYVAVTNLTNEAYETTSYAVYGPGSSAMPARQAMIGAKYKF